MTAPDNPRYDKQRLEAEMVNHADAFIGVSASTVSIIIAIAQYDNNNGYAKDPDTEWDDADPYTKAWAMEQADVAIAALAEAGYGICITGKGDAPRVRDVL